MEEDEDGKLRKFQEELSLNTLANEMFQKSADYLQGELLLKMVSYINGVCPRQVYNQSI